MSLQQKVSTTHSHRLAMAPTFLTRTSLVPPTSLVPHSHLRTMAPTTHSYLLTMALREVAATLVPPSCGSSQVGQMTQIDVTQLVSFTGDACSMT